MSNNHGAQFWCDKYQELKSELTALRNQVAELQGKLDEAAGQEPVCWLEADPSAVNESAHNVFGSMMYSTNICATKPDRGNPSWPLYAIPQAPAARYRFIGKVCEDGMTITWDWAHSGLNAGDYVYRFPPNLPAIIEKAKAEEREACIGIVLSAKEHQDKYDIAAAIRAKKQ